MECLPPVVDAVASLGAIPDSSEYADDVDVAEAREMIETVEGAPLTVVYRTLGGKAFCGALTGFRVNGEKTTLRAEVDAIGHFIAHVGELTEEELADFGSGQTDALRDMADKKPRTRAAMLRVAGVGEGKMVRYGDAFLREIARHEEEMQ